MPLRRRPHRRRLRQQPDAGELVSPPPEGRAAARQRPRRRPARAGLRLCGRVRQDRPRRPQGRHQVLPHHLGAVVAVRLRQLRPADDPHGLALGRHLPHRGRARRRRHRHAALRPGLQLVGQRQHRQVAPPAAAHQAQVRQRPVLGRPDGADRQLRSGDHGPADLRLRRRPARRLGGRQRDLLGPRGLEHGHPVRLREDDGPRQALAGQERRRGLRPREPARRLAPGADLRQPRGLERRRRPRGLGARHPRHLQPHGDERRGDGGADRGRPRLRQEPRHGARRRRSARRPRWRRWRPWASAGTTRAARATAPTR